MEIRERLLALLEENKGVYFSGEEIAEALSVSRTAVWKAVNSLRGKGYQIDGIRNKGYCLSEETDILSTQGIQRYLKSDFKGLEVIVLPTAQSTNALAREQAAGGAPEGRVIIANTQTDGRGRRGRSFFSPANTGVYMSLLLRPPRWDSRQGLRLTGMAAVAACEAIESVSGESAAIKWVNDIYVSGKKVCGILTEASFGLEDGCLEYAVLGIGINAFPPEEGFPEELQKVAGTVFSGFRRDGKNHLAAEFLNRFMSYYTAPGKNDFVGKYRSRSLVIGKEIQVISHHCEKKAIALDIDEDCHLIVEYEGGCKEPLSYGEIRVMLS